MYVCMYITFIDDATTVTSSSISMLLVLVFYNQVIILSMLVLVWVYDVNNQSNIIL